MKLCPRKSVGAVIKNEQGDYLCLFRKIHPKGLAFVAGHLDYLDEEPSSAEAMAGKERILESPITALIREVKEESVLKVLNFKELLHETFPNPCSKGYDSHEWFVYEITDYSGKAKLQEPSKHMFCRFLSSEEIRGLIEKGNCDPAWSEHIWPALGLFQNQTPTK